MSRRVVRDARIRLLLLECPFVLGSFNCAHLAPLYPSRSSDFVLSCTIITKTFTTAVDELSWAAPWHQYRMYRILLVLSHLTPPAPTTRSLTYGDRM